MKFKVYAVLVFVLVLLQTSKAAEYPDVRLQKKSFPSTGKLEGMTNIFFQPQKDSRFQFPEAWNDIEIASIVDNKAFAPIHVCRYKEGSAQIKYVVDTDADMDFRNEATLQFRQNDKVQIADTLLTIQPVDKRQNPCKVNYQVITSSDGYTYARISEYRQGEIRISTKSYSVFIRPRSRNYPLYNLSADTICLIDIDRDGSFSREWRLSANGEILQGEEIDIASPFILNGRRLRIVQLDPAGTQLKFEPTKEEISISVGLKAPDFNLVDTDKKVYSLKQLKGKIIFLEFWSVSCPFCKQILPQVNSLIRKNVGKDFVALAIAREENRDEIEAHLKQYPRNASVIPNEKATWRTYDSQVITPTYYLIDKEGVVRFSGYGASLEQN
jgi:thiol-disulfide isomerase/thioredoxin